MSTFNTIHDAVVALQTGKATKPEFFAFAKSRQTDTKPLLELMMTKVLTQAEVLEIIEEQKKLTARKTSGTGGVYFKVSEKGACSVYGLQRMPVTLYVEQWTRLLSDENLANLRQFLKDNDAKLSRKPAKV